MGPEVPVLEDLHLVAAVAAEAAAGATAGVAVTPRAEAEGRPATPRVIADLALAHKMIGLVTLFVEPMLYTVFLYSVQSFNFFFYSNCFCSEWAGVESHSCVITPLAPNIYIPLMSLINCILSDVIDRIV